MKDSLVLEGGLFDGEEYHERGRVTIDSKSGTILEAGSVSEIGSSSSERLESEVIKAEGSTILPGLTDAHVHFFGSKEYSLLGWVTPSETIAALRSVADLRKLLLAGFTAVRDMGSKCGVALSQAEKEGVIESPRIVSCSRSLAQTGGDDDPRIFPLDIGVRLSYSYFADGPWECRKAVRKVVRDGGEVVKVYSSAGFPQNGKVKTQLTVEELRAIVDEAHKAQLKVAAHAAGEDALENVIEAGVDCIDHGTGLTREIAATVAKKGIYYVPTLSGMEPFFTDQTAWHITSETADFIRRHMSEEMKIAREAGVKVVNGSDYVGATVTPHGQNYRELVLTSQGGLGNKEALISATSRGAECLGIEKSGRLRDGFRGDVVIVKGNPLRNIETLAPQNVTQVIKAGKIYTAPV